ncbi:MAG: BadF/BadG/BcrA/BcrD ATPase family protein [Gemmatimonadaceae bacterium]
MSGLVAGVDGGGSKTHVIIARADDGSVVAEAEGGGSAVAPGHAPESARTIASTVSAALAKIEEGDKSLSLLIVGVAGVGRRDECENLAAALEDLDIADEVIVETDAEIALEDAFGGGAGIILIAGTGSIAHGRGPTGIRARCGGWGPKVGDEGSGAWIGRRALGIVAAAHDGREPATALTGAILTAAQLNEPEELIPWAAAADARTLAALAPIVFATAATDPRAKALVDLAAEELVLHVRALSQRLFGDERADIEMAFAGGLMKKGSPLRKRVEHRLKSAVPGAHIHAEPIVAARGAVKLALRGAAAAG